MNACRRQRAQAIAAGIGGFGGLSPGLARNRRTAAGWRDFRI